MVKLKITIKINIIMKLLTQIQILEPENGMHTSNT